MKESSTPKIFGRASPVFTKLIIELLLSFQNELVSSGWKKHPLYLFMQHSYLTLPDLMA